MKWPCTSLVMIIRNNKKKFGGGQNFELFFHSECTSWTILLKGSASRCICTLHRNYHDAFDGDCSQHCFKIRIKIGIISNFVIICACDIIAKRLIMLMTVAMITIMNSNDSTNISTWEGFLLLSIYFLMEDKSQRLIHTLGHNSYLQQQARPVWNTEER